jgi:ribosomal protein S12 methylthiotransferase
MKFYIKRLGCPKNDVDGDFLAARLIKEGHVFEDDENRADVIIVNTCGFILPAKEESIGEILKYEQKKKKGNLSKLFVTGCLSQRYGEDLLNRIEGIDGVFGLGEIDALLKAFSTTGKRFISVSKDNIKDVRFLPEVARFVDERAAFAYLKIADGCDRFCSYCAIPFIRGRFRSRPMEEIVAEAEFLVSNGKRELILVSQEGTAYGRDLDTGNNILNLLMELEKIDRLEWIRLMYLHPEALSRQLINYMTESEKVLGYFDIPLQHINDRILKAMNRPVRRSAIEETLTDIRQASDKNIIRTTLIAGFPGETDKEFGELAEFVEQFKFDRLGVFIYSPEDGTAAEKFGDQINETVAVQRMDKLMSLQQEIAFEKNIALIDSSQKVIIDDVKPDNLAIGRTVGDCPEIDQSVFIKGNEFKIGDIVRVRVVMAEGYDLIAEPESGSL